MSDRPRLAFERVEIRRMPGIETGFAVDGLCSGINVICGPNASGKTTLTRAVSTMLWPRSGTASRDIVQGRFRLGARSWLVDYDSGSLSCQCDGQNSDFPVLDSADDSDRYLLALHDLLRADNRGFAEAILRESTGGYDVGHAIGDLGYTLKPTMPNSLNQQLNRARTHLRSVEQAQDGLRQHESRKAELQRDLKEAQEADRHAADLQRLLDHRSAFAGKNDADRLVSAFPPVVATLAGDELETLQALRERLAEAAVLIDEANLAIDRAVDRRTGTGLPDDLHSGMVTRLRSRCAELHELDMALRTASERRQEAEAAVAVARQGIGPDADDRRLSELDAVRFNALAELVNESREAHATLDALTSIADWIPAGSMDDAKLAEERDRLSMGVRCLTRWVRSARTVTPFTKPNDQPSSLALTLLTGLAVFEAMLLGVLAHPAFLVLLPVAVVLIVIGRRQSRSSVALPETASEVNWRREYEQLGLPSPDSWDIETVDRLIETMSQRLRSVQAENETRQRWQYVHSDRPIAIRRADTIDAKVADYCQQFGIPSVRDVAALHTLANAISVWQSERAKAAAAMALESSAMQRFTDTLRSINEELISFGYPAAAGYADATAAVDDLASRMERHTSALAEEQQTTHHRNHYLTPEHLRCRDAIRTFFERFDLVCDDDLGLRQLLLRLPDYREAKLAADRVGLELERATAALGDSQSFDGMAILDIETQLRHAQDLSNTRESIVQEIATIDARLEQARNGNDVEYALASERQASDELRDARDNGERLVAGWVLADFVQTRTRDVDRPRVFHRARELFARITHGRYELGVDGTNPPHFRARDTVTGTGHALDELSSGTRLQLLLAVRVAFVEQQERGPMLPLILDETLGNSDEHRARAIIDATVQIAREGRQVLYLTAQHDEVRKWQSIMADCQDVEFALIDLAQVRGLSDFERMPLEHPQPWPMPVVLAPNGHNRDSYGQLLRVPGIDLNEFDAGSIHLWHLIDDPSSLHKHLCVQIETWGQLRTLSEYGGGIPNVDDPALVERCRARALVFATIAETWQVGRGRPVDRAVLIDSGAITGVFLDRATDLAESLSGNAAALMKAIEVGRLPRFHSTYLRRLQTYFEEHGYIDSTPPLNLNAARGRVYAAASPAVASGLLSFDWVNQMLSTLWPDEPDGLPSRSIPDTTTLS